MTLFKRYIAVVLAVSTLLMCMIPNVLAEEQSEIVEKTVISEYEYLLDAIGVINVDENYMPNDTISKIDFIKALLAMMKVDPDIYDMDQQIFIDVPLTDLNAKYANCAFKMGVTNGYDDGNLGVNDPINFTDATTMICRVMGYQKIADLEGGYPEGYTKLASALDLYSGMKSVGSSLRNVDVAYMIYNALSAPMFETDYNGSYELKNTSTLFGVLYDLSYVIDIVQEDASGSILDSDSSLEDELLINGVYYDVPEKYSYGFLGEKVKAYYIGDDDTKEIIYMFEHRDNKILNLTSKDVASFNAQELSYDDKKTGKTKTVNISPYAVTIKNGNIFKIGNNTKATIKNGTYSLIDNNSDSKYDIIIIKDYRTMVVKDISTVLNAIYDIGESNPSLKLDDYDEVIITDMEGKSLELQEIQKDAVLRVEAAENKRYVKITVVYNTKEGSITEIETDADYQGECYVYGLDNGDELTTSIDLDSFVNPDTIKMGVQYKFLLDADGNVVYVTTLADVLRYGWLKAYNVDSGLEDKVYLKIFTTDGEFEVYSFENKVKLNGSRVSIDTFVNKLSNNEQLVRYKTNDDGVLTEIETESNEGAVTGFKLKASVPAAASSYTTRYYINTGLIGGKIAIGNNTIVFGIPDDGNEDNYQARDKSYVVNQAFYPLAKGYSDVSKNSEIVDCLVLREGETELNVDNPNTAVMLVKRITDVYDKESETVQKVIGGYVFGTYVEYAFRDDIKPVYVTAAGESITAEKGDVVWLGYDGKKKVTKIKVLYDRSTENYYGTNDGNDEDLQFGEKFKLYYGTPLKTLDGYFRIVSANTGEEVEYMFPVTNLFQYDETMRGDNVIMPITANDMETLSNNPDLKDKIFFVMYYQNTWLAVVYKKY